MVNNAVKHNEKEILGFHAGDVVQEFCWDEDVNEELRKQIEQITGNELQDEEFNEIANGIIVWWRNDDGNVDDLSDLMVECLATLDDRGSIWIFTPKPGRPNGIDTADIEEAARTAGLITTTSSVRGDWSGLRVQAHPRR